MILDYGAGNVPSVERAFRHLGAVTRVSCSAEELQNARALVLPGVGHFAALARALHEHDLARPILDALARGVPFLGICLGMHALYEGSGEAPGVHGLGVFRGIVEALPGQVKLPHMGWNQLQARRPSRLLDGVPREAFFYFAHSYAAHASGSETVASCQYGAEWAAVVEQGNVSGVQFHPEKSGATGARVLRNFLEQAV